MAQPHKGDRRLIAMRPPVEQFEAYKTEAEQLGLDLGEYAVYVMARARRNPVPTYILAKLREAQRAGRVAQLELEIVGDGDERRSVAAVRRHRRSASTSGCGAVDSAANAFEEIGA